MPFKGLTFFVDAKRKVAKTQIYDYSAQSYGNFYTSPCLFIVFFQIRFILHARINVFYINV